MIKLGRGNRPNSVSYLTVGAKAISINWHRSIPSALSQAISLSAILLLLLYIQYASRFESKLPDNQKIMAIETHIRMGDGSTNDAPYTPYLLRDSLRRFGDQVISATHLMEMPINLRSRGKTRAQDAVLADKNFFRVFQLKPVSGSLTDFGNNPQNIVITKAAASKYKLKVGDSLPVQISDNPETLQISGIVTDFPYPSQFNWQIFVLLRPGRTGMTDKDLSYWGSLNFKTFALLTSARPLQPLHKTVIQGGATKTKIQFTFNAIPIDKLFFESRASQSDTSGLHDGRRLMFKNFLAVTAIIFGLAVLAYINVTAAQIPNRAPEVSLRKLYGASRLSIIRSFVLETLFVMSLAGAIGLGITVLALPYFNNLLGISLQPRWLALDGLLVMTVATVLLLTIVASLYTSMRLAGVSLDVAVRNIPYGINSRSNRVGQTVVALQFIVGMVALAMAIISTGQLRMAATYDVGYDPQGVLIISGTDAAAFATKRESFEGQLTRVPFIGAVGHGNYSGPADDWNTAKVTTESATQKITAQVIAADAPYFSSLGIDVLVGSLSDYDTWGDNSHTIIVSRKMARDLGYAQPGNAVSQKVYLQKNASISQAMAIVGVVDDVRLDSLRKAVEPVFYVNNAKQFTQMFVKTDPHRLASTSVWIQDLWDDMISNVPLQLKSYPMLAETNGHSDILFAKLTTALSIVFCVTSLIAFWGLCLDTETRRKIEYTLHRLYGASPARLFTFLGKALGSWAGAGMIAGTLASIYIGHIWLDGFDVRTKMPWSGISAGFLVVAFLIAVMIACKVHGVLKSDIAETLKYE